VHRVIGLGLAKVSNDEFVSHGDLRSLIIYHRLLECRCTC
jgi:hypothetical protein